MIWGLSSIHAAAHLSITETGGGPETSDLKCSVCESNSSFRRPPSTVGEPVTLEHHHCAKYLHRSSGTFENGGTRKRKMMLGLPWLRGAKQNPGPRLGQSCWNQSPKPCLSFLPFYYHTAQENLLFEDISRLTVELGVELISSLIQTHPGVSSEKNMGHDHSNFDGMSLIDPEPRSQADLPSKGIHWG